MGERERDRDKNEEVVCEQSERDIERATEIEKSGRERARLT